MHSDTQSMYLNRFCYPQKENKGLPISQKKSTNVDSIVEAIRDCGVSFRTWVNRDTGKLEWSSLLGDAKKKILCLLPQKLGDCLPESYLKKKDLQELWKVNY